MATTPAKPLITSRKPLGRWSPGSRPGSPQAEMMRAARRVQRAVRGVFTAQREWLSRNWSTLLTPTQTMQLTKALPDVDPLDWGEWNAVMEIEVMQALAQALKVGGEGGMTELGMSVDWTLANPEAQKWIRQRGLDLAKGLNATTKDRLRAVIQTGLAEGRSSVQIREGLLRSMRGMTPRRAGLIAQTETINAHSEGALQVYRAAGVEGKKWLNRRPNACPLCIRLDGQVVPIDEPFVDPVTGRNIDRPSAHVSCQCAIRAVVYLPEGETS